MENSGNRILIIEDDLLIAKLERDYLAAEGLEADIETNGRKGLEAFLEREYASVILDVMLPEKNGFDICREIRRRSDIPILLVTARKEDIDKIRGFGLGADDYVVKPFSPLELVARVKGHLQIHHSLKGEGKEKVLRVGKLEILPASYRVFKDGKPVELTAREFELLLLFVANPNIVFSRERLFDRVWGLEAVGDLSTVTVHVNRLREKLEDDPASPKLIQTVWGVGYRFQEGER